ncbi:MAG: discoidin domain-containing protein [Phycisphaerae bacterium]|nr:discoidin domain-containing protein [Phycisphaerae bacterium]
MVVLALWAAPAPADIAISGQANWYSQAAADREMQEIVDNVSGQSIEVFDAGNQAALATWVRAHTGNGKVDLLILNGQLPGTIYAPGNTQADNSIVEQFLDDGNAIINTGDWIFYVVNSAGTNGPGGLQTIMDIPAVTVAGEDDTAVTVTAEGQELTPSLLNFATDRPFHLDTLAGDWYTELALAQNAAGTRADPVIVRNSVTGGRIGVFFQTASQDNDPRGEVISEWINNWFIPILRKSSIPSPADGDDDVPRDAVMSWKAGDGATAHDVYVGTVMDDVAAATRQNPMGVLVAEGQPDVTYDVPGLLDWGTPLYWRVDEVVADGAITPGDVWTFTSEPYAYPITNLTAQASSEQPASPAAKTIDGSGLTDGQHSIITDDMWMSKGVPAWIQYAFDKEYMLYELRVWNANWQYEFMMNFGAKDVTVEYSTDGETWTALENVPQFAQGTGAATYEANTIVDFGGVVAKYVKLTIHSTYGSTMATSLSEVRFSYVPVQAFGSDPADGATDVGIEAELSWRAGRLATSHEVYLGTDANGVAEGTVAPKTVVDHSYAPVDLMLATDYFWKVDEVGDTGTYEGHVWSFTTQEYLVVDDFDDYDDDVDAGTTIWQGWIDGIDDPTNGGAVVGYGESPFAEQTVVRSGQSMNFNYTNSSASAISEADHTLSPAQNWTSNGIQSLSLWFRGATGNTGTLYIKINNTKVPYDGPATDIGIGGWQRWNVVLADTGANLSNVTTLTVGVEGAGSGVVYFDDIRLVRTVLETEDLGIDIAISTRAGWFGQAAADREMQEIIDNVPAHIKVFTLNDLDGLADWVAAHTGDGAPDLLILCGQFPDTIYGGANAQPDGSLAELFLDDGNTIINTGDYLFYVNTAGSNNAEGGIQNMMDIPTITMWDDDTAVTVTADGRTFTPTLQDFATDRPFHLDELGGDWVAELVLAQNTDGTRADPVIVRNSVTGGRLGIFYQTSGQDDDPRGEVISEWINNWYLDAVSGGN